MLSIDTAPARTRVPKKDAMQYKAVAKLYGGFKHGNMYVHSKTESFS